ncbi:sigma-54-dependent Fis family transcriptional regulator [Natronospirillum operosum]|uniref:Sigma-54-dependent Fis family transcriptional regulator n=1 Tax=Natronospirillum operosum TaxID=2759953 RepID=A0A4Z0W8H0_9GAMM|nr:sigma-54 dependent transcriptional regulator [Natronospirillum operosum]TGG90261.1 sigma-54-dependent Fis family transcriptional regulator [Natronospirillum operosum]
MQQSVLLVEDDPHTGALFQGLFEDRDSQLVWAQTGGDARSRLRNQDFDLLVLDQRLPDAQGIDLLREIRARRPRQAALLITGYSDIADAVTAMREGAQDYLTKPFESLSVLEAAIDRALSFESARQHSRQVGEPGGDRDRRPLVVSKAMRHLMEQADLVAASDAGVLVSGETGTGKGVIAQHIHHASRRSKGPFIAVDCGAIPENLLEGLLFGYERGAFTGASQANPGLVEAAHQGTLFLDELGEMSPRLQMTLLRVLEERAVLRLGASQPRPCDFRVIAATHRNLHEAVKEGRFRADLFYRLRAVELHVPPLRERRDAIVPLAERFLAEFNARDERNIGPFTDDAVQYMQAAPWPGNVRELRHTIERIVATRLDGPIGFGAFTAGEQNAGTMALQELQLPLDARQAQDHFEQAYLRQLMDRAGHNVSQAARLAGLSRQALHARLVRTGIHPRNGRPS